MPNNTVPINFELNGLLKRLNYSFTVEGLGGNWPATIVPTSGEFTATAKSGTISAAVSFCSSSGCSDDTPVMPYTMTGTCTKDRSEVFSFVRLKAVLADDPTIQVYSDPVHVTCDTCIPHVRAMLPDAYALSSTIRSNDQTAINNLEFRAHVTGLVPKEKYNYRYESVDANWPVKVYPPTGQISEATDTEAIPTRIVFCNSTGVCQNGSDSVMDYTIDPECMDNNQYFCNLKLYIEPDSCAYDEVYSNTFNIDCNNCLPKPILGIPSRLVLTNVNNNYGEFVAIISGIVPYKTYNYEYKAIRSNWPILMDNVTGSFHSPTNTYCIDSYIEFSEATGVAIQTADNVLSGYEFQPGCLYTKDDYEAKISLEVTSQDCPDEIVKSNIMHLACQDCFPPDPTITLTATFEETDLVERQTSMSRSDVAYGFKVSMTNLNVTKRYNYWFGSEEGSNWPLYIPSCSGDFFPELSYQTMNFTGQFCESTGMCPSGYVNVVDHNPIVDSSKFVKQFEDDMPEYVNLIFYIQETDCEANVYQSNIYKVICTDCKLTNSPTVISTEIEP